MGGLIAAADRRFFAPGSARRLAGLRIGLSAILAVRLAVGPFVPYTEVDRALWHPVSFLGVLSAPPPVGVVVALQVAGALCAVLAATGIAARAALPAAWASGLVLCGVVSSTGKVQHVDIALLLCVAVLCVTPHADAWTLGRRGSRPTPDPSARYGWPVRLCMALIAGTYFASGLLKLAHSGTAWVTTDNMRWLLYASSDDGSAPNGFALWIADRPAVAWAAGTTLLLFELTAPLVLLAGPRLRLAWVGAALAMHGLTGLAIGADFSRQAATVAVVFVPWPAVADRLARVRARPALAGTS